MKKHYIKERSKYVKGSLEDRTFSVYNNKENVHIFKQNILNSIKQLNCDHRDIENYNYESIITEINNLVKNKVKLTTEEAISLNKGIYRINIDTTTIQNEKTAYTLQEILILVWIKIEEKKREENLSLKKRLI